MEWVVVAEPIGANPALKPEAAKAKGRKRLRGPKDQQDKDNVGGIAVYLQKGSIKEEVARVGFVRAASENPDEDFEEKLDEIIGVAQASVERLNELTPDGELQ